MPSVAVLAAPVILPAWVLGVLVIAMVMTSTNVPGFFQARGRPGTSSEPVPDFQGPFPHAQAAADGAEEGHEDGDEDKDLPWSQVTIID